MNHTKATHLKITIKKNTMRKLASVKVTTLKEVFYSIVFCSRSTECIIRLCNFFLYTFIILFRTYVL